MNYYYIYNVTHYIFHCDYSHQLKHEYFSRNLFNGPKRWLSSNIYCAMQHFPRKKTCKEIMGEEYMFTKLIYILLEDLGATCPSF